MFSKYTLQDIGTNDRGPNTHDTPPEVYLESGKYLVNETSWNILILQSESWLRQHCIVCNQYFCHKLGSTW